MTKEITENRLGVNLARFRKLAGYTQTEIGELIGVSQSLLAHYEAGRRNIPVSLLVPISDVLKISIIDLFDQEQGSVKLTALTPLEKRIEQLKTLPRSQQKMLLSMLDGLISSLPKS